jgi:alpha-N-acetylglucosaminidase
VPLGGILVLDMWSDVEPKWPQTDSFYGTPFIWNMLHNFGGRSGLYARLFDYAFSPAYALETNATFGWAVC